MYYRYYFGGDDDYCGLYLYLMMLLGQNDDGDENELRTKRLRYGVVVPLVDYGDDDLGVIVNLCDYCGDDDDGVRPFSF